MAEPLTPWTTTDLPAGTRANVRWRPNWLSLVRLALPLIAAVALTSALREGDGGRVAALLGSHLGWLPFVLLPFLAGMACDAASLCLILGAGGRKVSYRAVLRLRIAAEGALFTLPAGSIAAEALKPALLRRGCGVPLAEGTAAVVLNKAFIVITNAIYLILGLVAGGAVLRAASAGRWAVGLTALTVGGAVCCLALGLGLLLAVRRADLLARLVRRLPARLRARCQWREAEQASLRQATAAFFQDRRRPLACLGFALTHWLVEAFETYAAARLLGLALTPGGALGFESVLSLLRSIAFFLPGGIGVQDSGHFLLAHLSGAGDVALVGGALVLVKRGKELLWTAVAALLMPGTEETRR